MEHKKIVILSGTGFSTYAVYNALAARYPIARVIIEAPVDKKTFLQRRIKNLGWFTVIGQILFQAIVVSLLQRSSKKRQQQIQTQHALNGAPPPESIVSRVSSVNDTATIALLQKLQPDVIVVNGTRIISKKVLNSVSCKFINTHAGITPKYRGVHGTYWALANNDAANSGVTVHLVDAGIDTGGVLYQQRVTTTPQDNFATYPILQLAAGIPLLVQAVADVLNNNIKTGSGTAESKLWYHPTIWQYLRNRIIKKVK